MEAKEWGQGNQPPSLHSFASIPLPKIPLPKSFCAMTARWCGSGAWRAVAIAKGLSGV